MEELEHYIAEIEALEFELGQSCKVIKQQQAEIERLKEQCSKSSYKDSWKNKFFKAQEEIERLTRESDEMFDKHAKENQAASILIEKRNNEIAELQKQVDELKDERENVQKILYELGKCGNDEERYAVWVKLIKYYGLEVE